MVAKKIHLPSGLYPICLNLHQSAAYVGVSTNTFFTMVKSGLMPQPRCVGSRRMWIRSELETYVRALPTPDGRQAPIPLEAMVDSDGSSALDQILGT